MPRSARWLTFWMLLVICIVMTPVAGRAAPSADLPTPTATPPPPTATPTPPPPTATPTPTPVTTTVTPTRVPPEQPTVTPTPSSDPQVIKTAQPSEGLPGATITFSIVVRNDTSIPFTNVVIDDTVPDVFQITGATVTQGTVTVSGQNVHAVIGTIEQGQQVTLTITTVIRAGTPPGQVDNTAVLTTDTPGDKPGNNTSTARVTILAPPAQPLPAKLPPTGGDAATMLPALLALAALLAGLALRSQRVARKDDGR